MEEKKCSICGLVKPTSDFNKDSSRRSGLSHRCKSCNSLRLKSYHRSKNGLASRIIKLQSKYSKRRGHPKPTYNTHELREWLLGQKKFHEIYDKWVKSGYNKWLKPSCDRIDDYKPYTLENIRITTYRENIERYNRDVKNGVNRKVLIPVVMIDKKTGKKYEYWSIAEASRKTGVSVDRIRRSVKNSSTWILSSNI